MQEQVVDISWTVMCNTTDFFSHVIPSKTKTGVADPNKRGIQSVIKQYAAM